MPGLTHTEADNRLRGGNGSVLPSGVRGVLERKVGAEFSDVRIHTGEDTAAAVDALGADAVGMGSHEKILAHELTHVVQAREGY